MPFTLAILHSHPQIAQTLLQWCAAEHPALDAQLSDWQQDFSACHGLLADASALPESGILTQHLEQLQRMPVLWLGQPEPSSPAACLDGQCLDLPLSLQQLSMHLHTLCAPQHTSQRLPGGYRFFHTQRALHTEDNSSTLVLTEKEADMLQMLAQSYPEAVPHDEVLQRVWGYAPDLNTRTLQTHVYRLRQKLHALSNGALSIHTHEGSYALSYTL